jgi:hypothetical protein
VSIQIPVGYANVAIHLQCVGRSREYVVTHGITQTSPASTADGLAQLCDGAFTSGGAPASVPANMLQDYTYTGITLTLMTGTGAVPGQYVHSVAGTAGAGASPGNVAYIVRKSTNRGGKAGRGRIFVPCFNLAEGSIDSAGFMSGGTQAALNTAWNAYLVNLSVAGPGMFLLHGPNKAGTPIPPPDVVTGLSVELEVGTQRRRVRR